MLKAQVEGYAREALAEENTTTMTRLLG